MSSTPSRAVFDCNVFLQALANPLGPAGRCVEAALDGRFELFVDQTIIDEIVEVAGRPLVSQKLRILPTRVNELVTELNARAVFVHDVPVIFSYPRDPDDAHYVNLAIAIHAYLIVSRDKDLLDLMDDTNADGKRLREKYADFRVLTPTDFLDLLDPGNDLHSP